MKRSEAKHAAKVAGLTFYEAEITCPHGHVPTIRYVTTGKCLACSKTEGPRYREKRAVYAARTSIQNVARMAKWKTENPQRAKKLAAAYRAAHRQEIRAKSVTYRQTHPIDPLTRVVREARRRARKTNAGGQYTKADILRLMGVQHEKCVYCSASLVGGFSVDHIIPVVLNGHSNPTNLQLLCKSCNSSKGGKHPLEFARYIGLLI